MNLSPDDLEVMTLHANIFFIEGKLLEAEWEFDQVLALDPDYPWRYIYQEQSITKK